MKRVDAWLWMIVLGSLTMAPAAYAQEARGTIQGKVLDGSGSTVSGAIVSATNVGTKVAISHTSDASGTYNLPYLAPGLYLLSATAPGFKRTERPNIELRIDQRLQIDLTLELGNVQETISVTGQSPILETATANLGQVVDSRRVADLPTPDGSAMSLVYLSPGVANTYPAAPSAVSAPELQQNAITQSAFGGLPRGSIDFTLDGVPNTQNSIADFGSGFVNSPPSDIISEFKIETAFDASVGHTSGSVVNFVLKTGSNQLHGSAFYVDREPEWGANNWFANRAGTPLGDFTYRRWGATLTGPVVIPKVYRGHDRTFFTYGYEDLSEIQAGGTYTTSVPTATEIGGNFSSLLAIPGTGPQYQIYDPATTRPAAGGRFMRDPFPGNIIPASRINPISAAIIKHYPQPNAPGAVDGLNNFTNPNVGTPRGYYNHIGRVDHNVSDKQRFYVRVAGNLRTDGPYRVYWTDPAIGENWAGPARQLAVDDVYTISPTLVFNIRYGLNRYAGAHFPQYVGFDPATLGFSGTTEAQLTAIDKFFPTVAISGLQSLAGESTDIENSTNHSLFASLIKNHGNHSLKLGVDIRSYQLNQFSPGHASGTFTFDTTYTRGPLDNATSSPSGIGQGLAAFLLGIPTSGGVDRNDNQALTSNYVAWFLHDNWRITRRLTLDLGIRWEYQSPETERYNRTVNGFDPSAQLTVTAKVQSNYAANPDTALAASQFQVRGGLLFAGASGQSRQLWGATAGAWAPRFGFAYQAKKNLVVRGGFGIYPIQIGVPGGNRSIQSGYNQTTNLVPTLDSGQTFIANLTTPFPSGVLSATGNSLGVNTFVGQSISFYNPNTPTSYTMLWNFGLQYELPGHILFEGAYVANKAVKLQLARSINALPDSYLSKSPARDQTVINYLTANVPNPFAGLLPGTSLNGSSIARSGLLVPFPQFSGVSMTDYQGYSSYNSLQLRLEKRMSKGATLQVAYTFSKLLEAMTYLNAGDSAPSRYISPLDRPENLSLSGLYELPFGKSKPFLSNLGGFGNRVVSGWELGIIYHLTSGGPISFGNIFFNGDLHDIPLPAGQRTVDRWFNVNAGFVTAAAAQPGNNLRILSPYFSGVRAGIVNTWDMNVSKQIPIREQMRVEIRGEFLNLFNHPYGWAPPNTTPTSSAFGVVTTMYGDPRIIQLGVKFRF
jgi:hypothetical protein